MIDTARLNLQDVTISENAKLIIQPCTYEHGDQSKISNYDLFVDEGGEIVTGSRAYFNHKFFNLTILPKVQVDQPEIEKNKLNLLVPKKDKRGKVKSIELIKPGKFQPENFNSKIFVQFSFPRFKKETNFNPLKKNEMYDVLDFLSKELKQIGINCNIYESDLSRLDTFVNINTDENFQAYTPVFSLLEATRKKAIDWNGSTYLWKSGEHQITCYDKIEEIKSKIKDEKIKNKFANKNVLRIENRWTTKRKIFSKLKLKNIDELLSNYDYLRSEFINDIEKTIFKYKENQIEWITGKEIKTALQNFYLSGSRYWFNNFMKYAGYLALTQLTNPEIIIQAIDELEINGSESRVRVIKHRIKNQFRQAKIGTMLSQMNFLINRKSNKELYEEIKTKFYKVA